MTLKHVMDLGMELGVPRLSLFFSFFLSSQTMALDSTDIDQLHKSCYSRQPSPKEKIKSNKKKKNHNLLRITRRLALEAFMA